MINHLNFFSKLPKNREFMITALCFFARPAGLFVSFGFDQDDQVKPMQV